MLVTLCRNYNVFRRHETADVKQGDAVQRRSDKARIKDYWRPLQEPRSGVCPDTTGAKGRRTLSLLGCAATGAGCRSEDS